MQDLTYQGDPAWRPPDDSVRRSRSKAVALAAGLLLLMALSGFAAWQGVGLAADRSRAQDQERAQADQREAAERQANAVADDRTAAMAAGTATAVKLTSVGWQTIDADITAILAMTTGTFHDSFANRSQSFADLVRSVKSDSVGTVSQSAVESAGTATASVLVAITVETSNDGTKQAPRSWRMRVALERRGNGYLASDVEFVS